VLVYLRTYVLSILATKDAATGDPEPRDSMRADECGGGAFLFLV
jgi:hypothetical protein